MGVYDPTDEYDELDEPSEVSGIGEGRRKTLAAIDAKNQLDDPQSFSSLQEMLNAVREISLAHPDGRTYMAPPEDALDAIEAAYEDLPDEAQQEYLNDHRLYVKIRAARNRFNDWMGKKRREQEMPSPVEAGPANYPADKARDTARYAREGREELDEAIGKIKSAARGAKQRALESTGTSLAEHNEAKAQDKAGRVKDQLEPGDIVWNRDTVYGEAPWGVKRLNDKSVRLKRPHDRAGQEKPMSDEIYPEYDLTTVDYDSDFLDPTTREEWDDIDELGEGWDPALGQGYEAAIRHLMGEDWVDENLELGEADQDTEMSDSNDTYDPTEEFSDDRPQQDQLVEGSTRASADTESRVDEGGSESFVDDRGDVYDPTEEDTGEQSSLVSEEVEGQADLTGGQATEDPEYHSGPGAQEKALDRMAEGSWHPGVIGRGFDVQGSVANSIEEMGEDVSHVLKVADNLDDLTEFPGIGEASAASIRETIPELESRGVTRHGLPVEDVGFSGDLDLDDDLQESYGSHDRVAPRTGEEARWEHSDGHAVWVTYDTDVPEGRAYSVESDRGAVKLDIGPGELSEWVDNLADRYEKLNESDGDGGRDEWADAVEYIRGLYGDGYDDRIQLSNDLMDHGREEGLETPQVIGGEGVTQPLIRYQDVPPEDAWAQIQNSSPPQTHDAIRELIISYGANQAAEGADEDVEDDTRPAWHQKWLSDVTGIGQATEDDLAGIGISNLGDARAAYDSGGETWDEIVEILPSTEAKENLLDEIDAPPGAPADELEGVESVGGPEEIGEEIEDRMENAHYWAAQLLGWMKNGPNAGLRGTYYVDVLGGKPVLVMDADDWNESNVKAIKDGLRDYGFPNPLRVKGPEDMHDADEYRLFVSEPSDDRLVSEPHPDWREFEPTGGDGGDPDAMFARDQLEWDTPAPGDGVETYDPTKEWDPEAAAEQAKEMKKARNRPLADAAPDLDEPLEGTGLSPTDLDERGDWAHAEGADEVALVASGGEPPDWALADTEDPDEIEQHREMMGEIYDPSLEAEPDRPYRLDLDDDAESQAVEALGLLRRNYNQRVAAQGDVDRYQFAREDISQLVRRFNTDVVDQGLTEEEMDVMWAATSYFADEQGNTRDLGRLEDAMVAAENAAEEDDMSSDTGEIYDPTEEQSETIHDGDDVAGQVVVGERELDVPEPFGGWTEVRFTAHAIEPTPTRGTEAVYLSPSRKTSVVVSGTVTSNKWGITAYKHDEPIPEGADYNELRYGPGGSDSDSESWRLTYGNVVDGSAQAMLDAELPELHEVREHFGQAAAERGETGPADECRSAEVNPHRYPPKAVNGWTKVDAPTIEYQNPGNTALAHVEANADDTFRPRIQGDETGDERLDLYDTRTEATDALVEWMENHDPEGYGLEDADDGDDEPAGRAEPVEFGTMDAANQAREEYAEHLHTSDHRSYKTVKFDPETPEDVMESIGEDATISRADETKSYGQTELSDDEREKLGRMYDDWQWGTYGFEAMGAKAALQAEGVTDWLNYYEPGEGAQGALATLESGKEMAAKTGAKTATTGAQFDSDPDPGELGRQVDQAQGEACDHARDAAEDGYSEAARFLIDECGWSEEEVDELLETARAMGEEPAEIYDPTTEMDTGQSFADWARSVEPEPPSEPGDDEIAQIAPTPTPDELTGPALRALKKAWTGYKLARVEARESYEEAEKYAAVINGIRAVNGQEPLDFAELEGWEGGDVMPDDPTEEYPAPEGGQETLAEAVEHGHAAGAAQGLLSKFSTATSEAPYDPTEKL